MKTFHLASVAAVVLAFLAYVQTDARLWLLSAASAIAFLASTTIFYPLKDVRKTSGWPQNRLMLITLGVLASACFASTTINAYASLPAVYILALFALNTYLMVRLLAEALTYMRFDRGLAFSALILGFLSYLVYGLSFLEALRF
ncbi:MAG: hypothetical protein QW470_06200 [Candidatus Caldarchaeum sp.]